MTKPAFLLKIKNNDGSHETIGAFRKITPEDEVYNFTGKGIFFDHIGLERVNTLCSMCQWHEFVLSFEDGHKELGDFLIKEVAFAGEINGDLFYNVTFQRVIALKIDNVGTIHYTDPLREAVEKGLPVIAEAIETYDQLLACGDCGNRYDDDTRYEMQTIYDCIAAIRNALESPHPASVTPE